MENLSIGRRPIPVYYKDSRTGEIKTSLRRPAPKLHDIIPEDQVRLNVRKNDDWPADETYEVKHISKQEPNIIQIKDAMNNATFVNAQDLTLLQRRMASAEEHSVYLLWP